MLLAGTNVFDSIGIGSLTVVLLASGFTVSASVRMVSSVTYITGSPSRTQSVTASSTP